MSGIFRGITEVPHRVACPHPKPDGELILDTDASDAGIEGVLSQKKDGQERVIAFASKVLKKAEQNYCVTRRELLAVVTFLKHFRPYIYGRRITVRTDHGALRWLINFREPAGQVARWLQLIGEYDFEIIHRAGKAHQNADSLSRRPCSQCGMGEWDTSTVEETIGKEEDGTPLISVKGGETPLSDAGAPADVEEGVAEVCAIGVLPEVTLAEWRRAQLRESSMEWVIKAKEAEEPRPDWETLSVTSGADKNYWLRWEQISVRGGVLQRRWESDNGKEVQWQTLVPQEFRQKILHELHAGRLSGHLGTKRTMAKVRTKFYWKGMAADIRSFIRECDVCARRKSPNKKRRAPLQQHLVGLPMERVAMDITGPFPVTTNGNRYILVIGDYFGKWFEAYPISDERAQTVADRFINEFVCRYGVPKTLHTDQGGNFMSRLMAEACRILGVM